MGQGYLIDTNTIIDAQAGKIPMQGLQFLTSLINEDFTVSFVTYIEVLGYRDVPQSTQDFVALANVILVNPSIIDTCISLRKKHKIKLPDAIIAATALANNLTIISRNTKDFDSIEGLVCLNPYLL